MGRRGRFLTVDSARPWPVTAGVGASPAPGTHGGDPRSGGGGQARPNVVVIETDDQTLESMRVMDNVNSLIGDQGATFANSFVNYSLCCPSRATFLTGQYAHNHGVLDNSPPNGGFDRFESLHGNNNLAVWLQDAGYYTALIGKYLNGYNEPAAGAAGLVGVARDRPYDQGVYNYTLNDERHPGPLRPGPADFKQDVLTRKAVDFVNRRAPQPQPFFLWLTYTAPHVGRPARTRTRRTTAGRRQAGAAPRPCVRLRAAAEAPELQRGRRLRQAGRDPQPPAPERQRQIADIQRKYRCELESLLSVDEGVQEGRRRAEGEGRARQHAARSSPRTTASSTASTGSPGDKTHIYEESIRVPLQMRGPGIPGA